MVILVLSTNQARRNFIDMRTATTTKSHANFDALSTNYSNFKEEYFIHIMHASTSNHNFTSNKQNTYLVYIHHKDK